MIEIRKRLISGGLWAIALKLASVFLGLAIYAMLARLLSPDDLGSYFLIVSVVTFVSIIIQMGLSKTALRFTAQSLAEGNEVLASHAIRLTTLYVCMAGVLVGIVWLSGFNRAVSVYLFHSDAIEKLGWLLAGWFVVFAITKHFAEIFRGLHDIRLASLFEGPTTNSILFMILLWLFLFHEKTITLKLAVVAALLAALFASVFAAYLLNRKCCLVGSVNQVDGKNLWPVAWPLLMTSLFVFVSNQADLWILGAFAAKEDVALYGTALRAVVLISFPMVIAESVVQPLIVELHTKGEKEKLEKMLGATATIAAIPAVIFLLAVIVGGDKLLIMVFGDHYGESSLILTILCIGRTVNAMTGSCGQCLMMGGYQQLMMTSSLLFGGVSVAMAIFTVGEYGPVAVAISFAAGMILKNIAQAVLVKRYMGVSTFVSAKWLRSEVEKHW